MALVACRECGQPVSTEAAQCPRCGVPHPTDVPLLDTAAAYEVDSPAPDKVSRAKWAALLFAALLAIVFFYPEENAVDAFGFWTGNLLMAWILSGLSWAYNRVRGKPLTPSQYFSTFGAALLVVLALSLLGSRT